MGKKKIFVRTFIFLLFFSMLLGSFADAATEDNYIQELDRYIKEQYGRSNIPGLAVSIVKEGEVVYDHNFGYADVESQTAVTNHTKFELGSTTKAFTALGILLLEDEGKISLSDSVTSYLPWFHMAYKDGNADITIEQLLHHTSGIPYKTIGSIPMTDSEMALEQTIRNLVGTKLDEKPGTIFEYATINYDILGYIIEVVTGQTYQNYIREQILKPLGLNGSIFYDQFDQVSDMGVGYKPGFFAQRSYLAPKYTGNTPAGYLITNKNDMVRWLKIQLGLIDDIPAKFKDLIEESHVPDRTVYPSYDGSSYAKGWVVFQSGGGEITHSGVNPNYSSFFGLRPIEGIAVVVMANTNSDYTSSIGNNVLRLLLHQEVQNLSSDYYTKIDKFASSVSIVVFGLGLVILWYVLQAIREIIKGKRGFRALTFKRTILLVFGLLALIGFLYALYIIPDVLFEELPWSFINVWGPISIFTAISVVSITACMYYVYLVITTLFSKQQKSSIMNILVMSLISGFGNAFLIFVINQQLVQMNRDEWPLELLYFFAVGIVLYVAGQRLLRARLITITNYNLYRKRMHIIDTILKARFQSIERFGKDKIMASLNNDTEVVSNSINVVIGGLTSLITLICCLVYLGTLNFLGLLITIAIILVAVGAYLYVSRKAEQLWEETRDIQNVFFKYVHHVTNGFKELSMSYNKRQQFRGDMDRISDKYREKRAKGDTAFASVFVFGELLFTLVIGIVAFLLPILFKDILSETLRGFVFIFLYMTGPINNILNCIPQAIRMNISWKRIDGLINEVSDIDSKADIQNQNERIVQENVVKIEMKNVSFGYMSEASSFTIGPINCSFEKGEIVFITGGNGSGKSTFGKILTGLYTPDNGSIILNGQVANATQLSELFSSVFSDFHLFEKLYGVDIQNREEEAEYFLRLLGLENKVSINNDEFTTIDLSMGQRKRLALLMSYLEDRPFFFFDEWAADQDPEFRKFFYTKLLPEMKAKGKCVIAITHDDQYYSIADRLLKFEMGSMKGTTSTKDYGRVN
ncbi:hypothetical protein PMSD_25110 [Paenibacillus macquariensis subsp. defensor]|nr:hypothetical protein PMSD_25110 [Paenibacillus macquariensis subsp. defensor]